MSERVRFQQKVNEALAQFEEGTLSYDLSEFWMVQASYEFIEFFAISHQLWNTSIALPLSRGLHDGSHRKSSIMKDGRTYRLPYLIHPLSVCRMLINLEVPLSDEEADILFAAALCHDMIEDLPFENHGKELTDVYHLDPRVYETVKKVSKRKDFTEEEEIAHFRGIQEDPLALLVKLSDRGNNVEDLYNMSLWKVHEYVFETRKYFLPMCDYAVVHYPELTLSFDILRDKIVTLIEAAEILVDRYDRQQKALEDQVHLLREENERLRKTWKDLWEK